MLIRELVMTALVASFRARPAAVCYLLAVGLVLVNGPNPGNLRANVKAPRAAHTSLIILVALTFFTLFITCSRLSGLAM